MSSTTKLQKLMVQPISVIFRHMQTKATVQVWLFDHKETRIEGQIIGFDEFMNLVLDNATEISMKHNTSKSLGRIMLKGDTICLILNKNVQTA